MSEEEVVTLRTVPPSADDPAAPRPKRRLTFSRVLAPLSFAAAGLLFVASATSSGGTDLRAERQTDLTGLIQSQSRENQSLAAEVSELRRDVDGLAKQVGDVRANPVNARIDELSPVAGMTAVHGEGVTVTLKDAPSSARSDDVSPDALIVHQQDIQAVVNALWSGGAEAISIQGQRVISTSAIRCVGNSVVLHGVPYPPPYRIAAIGSIDDLMRALGESPGVRVYIDYVERFGLGYEVDYSNRLELPAFEGSLDLSYAEPVAP